jgi:prepilin-type N-terminal cleavage/methylation domain-containing protein
MVFIKNKGFTLVELLVVVAILAILSAALLPQILPYSDKAREVTTEKDIRSMCTIVEAFTATDGNYPEASLDTDNPRSIASIMQSKGVNWTGDATGKTDPWGNPYYYDVVDDYYCIASSGKNGTLGDNDDICNIGGKVSKKASGLDGNAIPSATPGNNPGGGGPEHLTEVPEGYIGIYTPAELASIGNDPDYPLDGNYIVMKDLDLSGYENWTPIGNIAPQFTGTFDGNNYVISNLTINSNQDYKGLFGCISETSEIKKIGLENINVAGCDYVGGLVGQNDGGTLTNCYAAGKVTGNFYTGGLVGRNEYGTITDCYATGEVTGNNRTGGLVGHTYSSSITSCYATGKVTGNYDTGGLVGKSDSDIITNCYATGSVTGNIDYTGGLVGYNTGTIENCYATGNITGDWYIGGLVGYNKSGFITNCYATGSVTGSFRTGGLVGSNSDTITNSYYNSETTGQINNGIGTPLTAAQMKQQANFDGWDFDNVWSIDNSYPFLINNEQIPHPGI